jgi:preprotein translocase subunit SecE
MTARAESDASSGVDTAKLMLAVVVLVAGIIGFYYFGEKSLLYRVMGILLSTIVSFGLVLTTAIGKEFLSFLREARVEVRKVIWPTRQETIQSTMMVVVMVVLVGILLWTLDAALFWGISLLTGQGK